MFTETPIHRCLIALLMLVIACGPLASCKSVAAQQRDRAPELQKLIADLVDVLRVRHHGNEAQHRAHYNQVRQAIGKWNASARSDADYELMAGWLRAAHRTACHTIEQTIEQSVGQLLPPVPTLSAQVSRTPLETPAVHVARKVSGDVSGAVPETVSETVLVAINLSELHSRIRGTNRELQKVEAELSLGKDFSAHRLADLAKLLGNLVRQRDFLALYYRSLNTSEQASMPRLLPVDTAIRLLTNRVTQLRHTLRRRGVGRLGTGSVDQRNARTILREANRLLSELHGE